MRTPFIAGNWKMHKTIGEAVDLVEELRSALVDVTGCDVAVCPPFPALAAVREALADTAIKLGAQNVYWEEKGAYTGEVSPPMLAGLCELVIVGHSERRACPITFVSDSAKRVPDLSGCAEVQGLEEGVTPDPARIVIGGLSLC